MDSHQRFNYQSFQGICHLCPLLIAFLSTACSGPDAALKSTLRSASSFQSSNQSAMTSDYIIQPGDEIKIKFFYNQELNEDVLVRSDGRISMQLIDEIKASGLSPSELDDTLTRAYSRELKDPELSVIVTKPNQVLQQVFVGGEVRKPGAVPITGANMSPLQAVIEAQGFLDTASVEDIIVIKKGPNSEPIPYRVNLKNAIFGSQADATFALAPLDVVYVPKSRIAEINLFVKQYIKDIFMYNGFDAGFMYRMGGVGASQSTSDE